ncbi:MAG: asparagine--tRNA ligase [Candidatus Cloacimonetes bacterium 4572_55]|nr:MAG: asparagine--tRNA ligase [Candidatus Cloacimonetes bacterium 4572_55]
MKDARIEDIGKYEGLEVTLKGWLYNLRSKGKLHFLQVRDGSGIIQAVMFKPNFDPEFFKEVKKLPQESSIIVTGKVKKDKRSALGYELDVTGLEIIQKSDQYPIQPKEHSVEFLLPRRHLWIRSRMQWAILRIRAEIIRAIRDYLDDSGFLLVDTPIFTPAACEGTTTLFETQYDSHHKAYLTQSGQLYNEATIMAFGKTYCFGPTFRAEKSKTRRHLREFWMVEPEMAYAHLEDVIRYSEGMIMAIVERVLDRKKVELEILERDVSKLEAIQTPFPRMSYQDAVKILHEKGVDFKDGGDFGSEDETILSSMNHSPLVVHRFPSAIKAFYMEPDPEDDTYCLSVDFLVPEGYGEVIGGGERMSDPDLLLQRVREHNLPEDAFQWYIDLRRYGSVPHGGFGLGIERTVAWMCGIEHIRETIAFPRMLYKIYP